MVAVEPSDFGPLLAGLIVATTIFGLTTLQVWMYFQRFPNDSRCLKAFVGTIWVLDTLHVAFCTHSLHHYLVEGFGNRPRLQREVWSMALQTDCNGLIGMAVELFFARRVYRMSGNWIITFIIIVLASIHFGLGIYFTVGVFQLKEFSKFANLTWVTCVGLGSAATADIIIAITMVTLLRRARTGVERTDSLIDCLIVYAINTGAVTSIVATTAMVLFVVTPTKFIWLSWFWILGKLYANSLMASLNSRDVFRGKGSAEQEERIATSIIPLVTPRKTQQRDSISKSSIIKVNLPSESDATLYQHGYTDTRDENKKSRFSRWSEDISHRLPPFFPPAPPYDNSEALHTRSL